MGSRYNYYRMKTLMEYMDIDAFTAQKRAGSRPGYFVLLDQFVEMVPKIVQELEQLANEGEAINLVLAASDLIDDLEKIGATALIWEAERVVTLARNSASQRRYIDETFILTTKLRGLQERLIEARISNPGEGGVTRTQSAAATGDACDLVVTKGDRQLSEARSEPFEKLMVLIENFEIDDALDTLGDFLTYSYGAEIDAALVNAYNQLSAYEYEASLASLARVLKIIESGGQNAPPKAILAVDDVPDVLSTVKSILGKRYNVYGVTNHKAAQKFLTSRHADLILLDIELPDMDGFTMLDLIRETEGYAKTPVIFLTGNVSVENVKKSYVMGASDFIRKPISADVLLSKVDQHMVY